VLDAPVNQYEMPFESEVGLHPSLEDMQDVVVTRRLRPPFSDDWIEDVVRILFQLISAVFLVSK